MRTRKRLAAAAWLMAAGVARGGPTAVADSPAGLPNWPVPVVAPLLSAEEAIKTVHLPPGFRMEVVAAEPLVEHPVAMSWDPDGRLWVAEMRGYMPDVEGAGEDRPVGRISILEDTDGDGRMDKATVFLDHLVLPRAVSFVRGGVLLGVPPRLMFCRDTNGDGKCDEQTVVETDFGVGGNPEHQPNGLMPGLDNWIYSANYGKRLKWVNGGWVAEGVSELGQWGITQDDWGRLFHNSNTDQLRGSFVPPYYVDRNPHYRASGANEPVARDQTVWPLHPTAVDRGYVKTLVRDDGTMRTFTAACAPCVYRGGVFPKEYEGNAFVCEPAGNMIKRNILSESGGRVEGRNAVEGEEFLASTYERFRPVNLYGGPDGGLYVVDMHHGLLQHKTYLTTYCKEQYLARQLEKHLGSTGRIYRIVPVGATLFPRPAMSTATVAELVGYLGHPNGWWRDTAQRLLVERGDFRAVPLLKKVATTDANPLARLHAMWAVEGLRGANAGFVAAMLGDQDAKVRAGAVRVAEGLLVGASRGEVLPGVLKLAGDRDADVRLQFALTVSGVGTAEADGALVGVLTEDCGSSLVRDAVISGLRGRELAFLKRLSGWTEERVGRREMLGALARCVMVEGSPRNVGEVLKLVAGDGVGWRRDAMLGGLAAPVAGRRQVVRGQVMLEGEPTAFLELGGRAKEVLRTVHWPGEAGYVAPVPPAASTAEEAARFERGKGVYAMTCVACHKGDGMGQEGLAPPLVDSEWVLGPAGRVERIVVQGLAGPVTVGGRTYGLEMPALAKLSDEEIAAVITYVRRNWEHGASPVTSDEVKRVRATTRPVPWTERELLKVP